MQEVSQEEIEKLLKYISEDDYLILVENFLHENSELLKSVSDSGFKSDPENVIRSVHSIKGNSSSLGFDRLSNYSAKFEELLKNQSLEKKSDIFVRYRNTVSQSLTIIKQFFNDKDRGRV